MKRVIKVSARSANRALTKASSYKGNYSKIKLGGQLKRMLPDPVTYYSKLVRKFYVRNTQQAVALCPFHNDRRPSLSINLKGGMYFCFSCGKNGKSIVSFQMQLFSQTSKEAINAILGGAICC